MSAHLMILPVVVPLLVGALLLWVEPRYPRFARWLSGASVLALLVLAMVLLRQADSGQVSAYLLGNWQAPFGIALALDRLSALMLLLTASVATLAWIYSRAREVKQGAHFDALFQFQLMGLNGAFLTADVFNLFVFFEVLLIASYGLLLHGADRERLKAAMHYVAFNVTGSALFLIAASLLYGLTGTLNMADLGAKLVALPEQNQALAQAACLLLVVVFAVKAALLPLNFWLPSTYAAAAASVAALFAIMTKVGIYGVALCSLFLAALAALSATGLRALVAQLVLASAGMLLYAIGVGQIQVTAAGLFYMVNSTLATCGLFLLAERVMMARGSDQDRIGSSRARALPGQRLALLYFVLAVAVVSMPPLSGFFGKLMLLKASIELPHAAWWIGAILLSSFLLLLALARAGIELFWNRERCPQGSVEVRVNGLGGSRGLALWLCAGTLIGVAMAAAPLARYTQATAEQLAAPGQYINAVLSARPVPAAHDVRSELRAREASAKEPQP